MNEIKVLKKYLAQRKRWHKWNVFNRNDSDFQRLRRQEGAIWVLLIFFINFSNLHFDSKANYIWSVFLLCFVAYLIYQLYRTRKLLALFEWSAIQSCDELIAKLENMSTEQAGAGYPPQGVGSPDP